MRLVEVNGAGWCVQQVPNRRGPGHLIICLLVARRRTNRSCGGEARSESRTQRSHARHRQQRGRAGTSWKGCSGRATRRSCTSAAAGDARSLSAPPRPAPPCPCWSPAQRSLARGWEPPPPPPRTSPLPLPPLPLPPPRPAGPGRGESRPRGDGEGRPPAGRATWAERTRGAEARASPPRSELPLRAQGLNSGARLSLLLCAEERRDTARGCALHSAAREDGGRHLCAPE